MVAAGIPTGLEGTNGPARIVGTQQQLWKERAMDPQNKPKRQQEQRNQ